MKEKKLTGPDPLPQVGDKVNYCWPEISDAPELIGKCLPATVKSVHAGHNGRLLDIEVDTGAGNRTVKNTPFQSTDDERGNGNTWHFPEVAKEPTDPKKEGDDEKDK